MIKNRDAILILFAGLCWSLSGIGVRLIPDANVWQIVLYRSISMSFFLGGVVYYMTSENPIKTALEKGLVGWVCWFALVLSYVAGIYALQTTSVANTLLLFSTAPFQTSIMARLYLGEMVSWLCLPLACLCLVCLLWLVAKKTHITFLAILRLFLQRLGLQFLP